MVAFTSVFAILATLAATSTHVTASPSDAIHQLLARQSSTGSTGAFDPSLIPEQCRSQCAPLAESFTSGNCLDLDCLCGPTISNAMSACLRCGIGALGADTAQSYYNNYADACTSAGKSVPSFSAASASADSGASRVHIAGAGLAGALGVGFLLAA